MITRDFSRIKLVFGVLWGSSLFTAYAQTLTPAVLNFGNENVGSTSAGQTITVSNGTSASDIEISGSGANYSDFSLTTSCGTSLAANGTCSITVAFKPSATGSRTGTVAVSFVTAGSGNNTTLSTTLTGTGTAPSASLSPVTLTFPSTVVGVASTAQPVTLSNSGTGPLSITSIALGGTAAGDFSTKSTCGTSLAASANCSISITFTPTAAGSRLATLSITDNATGSPQTVSITGTGATGTPVASYSASLIAFGSVNIGTTATPQSVTLTNTGTAPLAIAGIAIGGTNSGDFTPANTCPTSSNSLAVNASCSISASFDPSAAGARLATITITDNAGTPQIISLTGTGVTTAPVVSISPASLTFPSTSVNTTSAAQTLTVTNTGTANLTVTSVAATTANYLDYAATTDCTSKTVPPNGTCTISVTFTPTAIGTFPVTITVSDNAAGGAQAVSVTGTGVGVGTIALSPLSLTFPSTNTGTTSAAQAITVSNSGTAAVIISNIGIAGTNSTDFASTNTCNGSVAAGGSCSISVTFAPSAAGTRTATLSITDNASGSPQTATLSGTGAGVAAGTLSPASLTFGSSNIGTKSAVQTTTLSNGGTGTLIIAGIAIAGADPADFIATNNCNGSVAANGSCMISVTFLPTTAGARAATLTVADNASSSPQTATLTGTGVAVPSAALSPTALNLGNSNVGVVSGAQSLTLTNSGTGPLTIIGISLGGTNSGDFAQTNNCGTSLAASGSCTIVITFNPTAAGARAATLTVADNSGNITTQQTASLSGTGIAVPIAAVTPSSLGFGNVVSGTTTAPKTVSISNTGSGPLTFSSVSIGGTNSANFSISANTCADSLAAGSTCTISVTFAPNSASSLTAQLNINDNSNNTSSTQSVTLSGGSALTIQTTSLPNGTVGTAYSTSVVPQGGTSPYTWSVSAGSLPSWATLNTATGAITGTPNAAGATTFTIKVSDSGSQSITQPYTLTIAPAGLAIQTTALSSGTVGVAYSTTIQATGGTTPYKWAASSGLPSWGTLTGGTGAGTETISGTPTAAGTFTFTITLTDAGSPVQTVTQQYSIVIAPAALAITTTSLPNGTSGTPYSAALAAQGGTTPYAWSISAGALPTSLALNSGVISGTPSAAGSFSFTVTVTDNAGKSTSQAYLVTIAPSPGGTTVTTVTGSFNGLPANPAPGSNITGATMVLNPASNGTFSGTLDMAFTPNASLSGLPAGYQGDAGFVTSTGAKSATSPISATVSSTSTTTVPLPSIDPGTVAGILTISLAGQSVNSTTLTIAPAVPIIESGSVQITNVTSSGFDVELVATSTPRNLQTATFIFNPASGAQLTGTTTFAVNVSSLLSQWFASSSGLTYGGAFSLTIPFTLSGSSSAIGSVNVTLTNSVGTSASVTGIN